MSSDVTHQHQQQQAMPHMDKYFVLSIIVLLALGLLMVASASMVISERQFGEPFHYFVRQLIYAIVGIIAGYVSFRTPLDFWLRHGSGFLLLGFLSLVFVLVPGVGHTVNGSTRWIGVGFFHIQVSEFMKLAMVFYMAGYLLRHEKEMRSKLSGFVKPMLVLSVIAVLLLKQPDFGATVVITLTVLTMLYLAGVRLWPFAVLVVLVAISFWLLVITAPYRMERLTSFLHPWANQFGSGYQLTQSLIAFGRGGFWGVGLGNSIQKLFYLPEAHTDFLFAVLAEELGLIGILCVIGLYAVLVWRSLLIGRRAQESGMWGSAYMAYGFSIWMAMQAVVNIGVTSGILPTKGLTLPLMSYGGSSMVIDCIVIGILLKIDVSSGHA